MILISLFGYVLIIEFWWRFSLFFSIFMFSSVFSNDLFYSVQLQIIGF